PVIAGCSAVRSTSTRPGACSRQAARSRCRRPASFRSRASTAWTPPPSPSCSRGGGVPKPKARFCRSPTYRRAFRRSPCSTASRNSSVYRSEPRHDPRAASLRALKEPLTPAVEIVNVARRFGPVQALAGVDLAVEAGEFFGLLGPNGAGKTTLISILAGLTRADAGAARVLGHDVVEDYRNARRP